MDTNSTYDSSRRNRLNLRLGAIRSDTTDRLKLARRQHLKDPLVGGLLIGFGTFLYDILGKVLNWNPY